MRYDKAVKAALNYARNWVPIKTGRLRYKFIRRTPAGDGIVVNVTTKFNYPDYINKHKFRISNPSVKGNGYTKDWEKRFCDEFAKRLAKDLGREVEI